MALSGIEKERRQRDYQYIRDWLEFNGYQQIVGSKPVPHAFRRYECFAKIENGKFFQFLLVPNDYVLLEETKFLGLIPLDGIQYDCGAAHTMDGVLDAIETADDLHRGQHYLPKSPRVKRCASCGELIAETQQNCKPCS